MSCNICSWQASFFYKIALAVNTVSAHEADVYTCQVTSSKVQAPICNHTTAEASMRRSTNRAHAAEVCNDSRNIEQTAQSPTSPFQLSYWHTSGGNADTFCLAANLSSAVPVASRSLRLLISNNRIFSSADSMSNTCNKIKAGVAIHLQVYMIYVAEGS